MFDKIVLYETMAEPCALSVSVSKGEVGEGTAEGVTKSSSRPHASSLDVGLSNSQRNMGHIPL